MERILVSCSLLKDNHLWTILSQWTLEALGGLQPWQPAPTGQQQRLQRGEHLHLRQDPVPRHRDRAQQRRLQRRPEEELQADAAQVQGAAGGGGLCHQGGWGRVEASLERPASSSQLATLILFQIFFPAKYTSDLSVGAPLITFFSLTYLRELAGLSENVICEFCCFGSE